MKRRSLKLVLLALIGWYIAGPVAEAIDRWDDIRAETGDIARSAGGSVTFVMAGVALAMALLSRLKARCAFMARSPRGRFEATFSSLPLCAPVTIASASHSPPIPLRI